MKNSIIASSRFPEFFKEEFPDFISFIDSYYSYLDTLNFELESFKDLDLTNSTFLEHFREVYAKDVPIFPYLSGIEFLRKAAEVYSSRGTERCLRFLFRAAFNEEINVSYPKFNMLRAQESTWEQDYHIRLQRIIVNDNYLVVGDTLQWHNDNGNFEVVIKKIDRIDNNTDLLFFQTLQKLVIIDDQIIDVYRSDSLSGSPYYSGRVKKTLQSIEIINPGKFWQRGYIVTVPSGDKDTLLRIGSIGTSGVVTGVEIIQYGHQVDFNSQIVTSPYKKPANANITIDYTITQYSPLQYAWTIDILDETDGFSENLIGVQTSQDYAQTDYFGGDYVGQLVFAAAYINKPYDNFNSNEEVSIEDYVASKLVLKIKSANLVKTKGKFTTHAGLVQNNNSVIQDNFYYQSFSYVIETQNQYALTKPIIDFTHPAGTKNFIESKKSINFGIKINGYRKISQEFISVFDIVPLTESIIKDVFKPIDDPLDISTFSELINKSLTKPFVETFTMQDGSSDGQITSYHESEYFLGSTYYTKSMEIK